MAHIPITAAELPAELKARIASGKPMLIRAVHMAAARGRSVLVPKTPFDLGFARNAWRVRGIGKGPAKQGAVLHNSAPYIGIIEMGARPHPVSRKGYEAIYGWVVRNRHYFTPWKEQAKPKPVENKGWTGRGRGGAQVWEEDPVVAGIAHGICWSIRKKGRKPLYFVRDSMPMLKKILVDATIIQIIRDSKRRMSRRGPLPKGLK